MEMQYTRSGKELHFTFSSVDETRNFAQWAREYRPPKKDYLGEAAHQIAHISQSPTPHEDLASALRAIVSYLREREG